MNNKLTYNKQEDQWTLTLDNPTKDVLQLRKAVGRSLSLFIANKRNKQWFADEPIYQICLYSLKSTYRFQMTDEMFARLSQMYKGFK